MIGVIIVGGGEFAPGHHGVDHAAKIIGPLNVPVREHQPRQASPAGLSEIDQASAQFITRDMAKPLGLPVPVGGRMVQPLSDELIRRRRVRQFFEKGVCFAHD